MIQVKELEKSFSGQQILKGINTVFEQGKTNLIIGQSGSGKTVLMKCLVGLLEPDGGSVFFDNINFTSMKGTNRTTVRKKWGCCFREVPCLTHLR